MSYGKEHFSTVDIAKNSNLRAAMNAYLSSKESHYAAMNITLPCVIGETLDLGPRTYACCKAVWAIFTTASVSSAAYGSVREFFCGLGGGTCALSVMAALRMEGSSGTNKWTAEHGK